MFGENLRCVAALSWVPQKQRVVEDRFKLLPEMAVHLKVSRARIVLVAFLVDLFLAERVFRAIEIESDLREALRLNGLRVGSARKPRAVYRARQEHQSKA